VVAGLDPEEPEEPCERSDQRDPEVQAHAEDVDRVIDPQGLLEDTEGRIPGHVEREQRRRPDLATVVEPDQHRRERQVPDDLVQEGRLEGGVLGVPGRAVRVGDLQRPWQRRGLAEQFLVEVVADPADRLRHQQ